MSGYISRKIIGRLIEHPDDVDNNQVRVRYGLLAGWVSIVATVVLFVVKMTLGLLSGSISVIANAFHLLSHLANAVVLVISFTITARPATAKNPFGHGRMEHVAPLVMSIFLFVSGIQLGERSIHRVLEPHGVHYWPALPWILFATILVKEWLSRFVSDIGEKIHSRAILTTAAHHRIESVMTLAVIAGLVAGHHYHHPEIDGYIGSIVSLWLLYLGYSHGREAIVPLLGQAPGKDMIRKIRETARSVEGVEGVHEIIVHDYGSMYLISLHAEMPERAGPAEMHEVAERCERRLRKVFGGEAVIHTDPLAEHSPETREMEEKFACLVRGIPLIYGYHDFRIVTESQTRVIIVADIDVAAEVPESDFESVSRDLQARVASAIPNVAYSVFYVTPKFAY